MVQSALAPRPLAGVRIFERAHIRSTCSLARPPLGPRQGRRVARIRAAAEDPKKEASMSETTEKYGLEAGLFKVFTNKSADKASKAADAKSLLKTYGSAYLVTSISFAIVSYAICYILVDNGVDVSGLLSKVGISTSATSEKVGTAAIAYAAHKAASPIRFPPTVALTPIVAKALGKEANEESEEDSSGV